MRVIEVDGLEKVRRNLRDFATQLIDPDVAFSATEVAKRLAQFELSVASFVNAFSKPLK
jgi:hypothetical protein